MRDENCTPLWHEAHLQVKKLKAPHVRSTFGSWNVEQAHAVVARRTFRSQKCKKTVGYGALLDVQMPFCVAGARDCAPCQKWAKHEGFVALPKAMAGVGTSQNAFARGRQLCTQLSISEGSLTELLRFWCCQLRKKRKCRRIVSFLTLSS